MWLLIQIEPNNTKKRKRAHPIYQNKSQSKACKQNVLGYQK